MDGTVGAIDAFEKRVETEEVTGKSINHAIDTLGSKGRIPRIGGERTSICEAAEWDQGEVPADAVRNGIRPYEIRSKCPCRDLEVV